MITNWKVQVPKKIIIYALFCQLSRVAGTRFQKKKMQILNIFALVKYRKYRVIIVSIPKISCNIVWTPKKNIAEGWSRQQENCNYSHSTDFFLSVFLHDGIHSHFQDILNTCMPGEQSHTGVGSGLIPATVNVTWKRLNTDLC